VTVECDLVARPALLVQVRDSITGADITRWSTAVARDGEYVDTSSAQMRIPPDLKMGPPRLPLAYRRPASYTLLVHRPGYHSWRRPGIRVQLDSLGCGVETVDVTARLLPVPALAGRAVPAVLGPVVAVDSRRRPRLLVQEGRWVDQLPWTTSSRIWVELDPRTPVRDAAGKQLDARAVTRGVFLHGWTTGALPRADSGRVAVDSLVLTAQ
jgi:hypothetical protein